MGQGVSNVSEGDNHSELGDDGPSESEVTEDTSHEEESEQEVDRLAKMKQITDQFYQSQREKLNEALLPDDNYTNMCRICHGTDNEEEFISPCRCTGTMKFVHVSCLKTWLALTVKFSCESCGYDYIVKKDYKYSLYKSILIWFSTEESPRKFIKDVVGFAVFFCLFIKSELADDFLNCVPDLLERFGFAKDGTVSLTARAVAFTATRWLLAYYAISVLDDVRSWFTWWRAQVNVTIFVQESLPEEG